MSIHSLFVCPCISRQKKKIKYFVLIMYYDFILICFVLFYYYFRGLGGMFNGNQFTYVFFIHS